MNSLPLVSDSMVHLPTLQEICEKVISNADPLTIDDRFCLGEEFELENGLKGVIHTRQDPYEEEPFVQVRLVVKVGNNHERPDQKELAHLLEHCLFQGADDLEWEDIQEILGQLHCATSADSNATTHEFYTTYYFTNVPLESLKLCLTLLYKMVAKPTFPKERVLKEMQVVQNELLKRRQSVAAKEWKFTVSHVEEGSGLIDHLEDGFFPEVVAAASDVLVGKLIEFHETWYRADNMALIIVGDLDGDGEKEESIKWIKELFAQIPKNQKPPLIHPVFFTPQRQNPGFFEFCDPEVAASKIAMYWPAPDDPFAVEHNKGIRWPYIRMLYHMSSLVFHRYFMPLIVNNKTPLTSVRLIYPLFLPKSKTTFIHLEAFCRPEFEAEAFQDFLRGVRIIAQSGMTSQGLKEVGKGPSGFMEYARKSADGMNQNEMFALQYEMGFGESLGFVDVRINHFLMDVLLKKIIHQHPEDVNDLLKHHFCYFNERKPVFIVSRQSAEIEGDLTTKLEEIYYATGGETIEDRPLEDLPYSLDIEAPSPCSATSSTFIKELRTTELHYSNQSVVYLKKTLDPDRILKLDMIFPEGRDWVMTREEHIALVFVDNIIGQVGIGNGSIDDLARALRGTGLLSFVPPDLTLNDTSTKLSYHRINGVNGIKTALELFFSRLTDMSPLFNEHFVTTFERNKSNFSKNIEKKENTPMLQFQLACSGVLWNNHPLIMPVKKNEIDTITIEACRSGILKLIRRFSNPKVVLTGNYSEQDVATIQAIIDCYVGGLSLPEPISETVPLGNPWEGLSPPDRPIKKVFAIGEEEDYVLSRLYIPIPFMGASHRERFNVEEAMETFEQFLNANIRFKDQKNYGLDVSLVTKSPKLHEYFKVELVTKVRDAEATKEEVYKLLRFVMDFEGQTNDSALKATLTKSSEEIRNSNDKNRYLKRESTEYWHDRFVDSIENGGSPHELIDEEDWRNGKDSSEDLAYLSKLLQWGSNTIEMVMMPKESEK